MSLLENRKSTRNIKKASVERNAAILDSAGIISSDYPIPKSIADRDFESDNDIIRKRVQKELQRIKTDENDSEEYNTEYSSHKNKRGRRKSTENIKKASVKRNAAMLDSAGISFTDNEEQRSNSIWKSTPDRDFESDNDIIRKRVQKELQRIKTDENDSEEYKNKSTKRRTTSNYLMTDELVENKTIKKSRDNSELNVTGEKSSEKKTVKIKTFMKPSEVSTEKETRDNGQAKDAIQMQIDSVPVIECSQDRELICKPFKIPASHQFQKIEPGEHIVIKDCQSTVDLVVKGPKTTSSFNVINKCGVNLQSGRNLFPECDDSKPLVLVENPEIAEADSTNLHDQVALDYDNNSSVLASVAEESDNDTH